MDMLVGRVDRIAEAVGSVGLPGVHGDDIAGDRSRTGCEEAANASEAAHDNDNHSVDAPDASVWLAGY